jgi:restriction endonuclease Mrr
MSTRADRIAEILKSGGGRMAVSDIAKQLQKAEGLSELVSSTVSATVSQDNRTRDNAGRALRFSTFGNGEDWGYISLKASAATVSASDAAKFEGKIPQLIEGANEEIRKKLRDAVSKLTWQQFEANFLVQILEALGFRNVELTQQTRDGGKDAECRYERGIVESTAIVSAKHWQGTKVPVTEVQRLRGIKGNADTGIVVTSSSFTPDAEKEAVPSQNQRSIVLIDGDLIVDTCLAHSIGVRSVELPKFYEFIGFDKT